LIPADVNPLPQTLDAIARADIISIGPGSLFTSLIPKLAGARHCRRHRQLAGDQGLYLQPDDAGQ
jgi:hypothetical protein